MFVYVVIICEVGLNHQGDEKYASEYINKIISSKTDAILFHIRESEFYAKNKKFLLSDSFYIKIGNLLHKKHIKFGITIADISKIEFCEKIGVDFYKIFGRDLLKKDLVNELIKTKKPLFASTSLSNFSEISRFMKLIKNHKNNFTIIHTQFDNDIKFVNLKSIPQLKQKFKIPVAYGNHCNNLDVIPLSLAFEPSDIFFYVKGNRKVKHLDENHAILLSSLKPFIKNLRVLQLALGKEKIKMNYSPTKFSTKIRA